MLNFVLTLEGGGWKIQTIFELYTDDNKSKDSSNPMNTLKSTKKIWISTPSALPHWLCNHFHFHFDSP